jgi:hypothetical protein
MLAQGTRRGSIASQATSPAANFLLSRLEAAESRDDGGRRLPLLLGLRGRRGLDRAGGRGDRTGRRRLNGAGRGSLGTDRGGRL